MLRPFRYAILIAAAATLAACATQSTSSGSVAASKKAAAKIGKGSQVTRATLDNGLKVVVVRDAFAPVATQQITYKVGANEAPRGFPGMAHAQEHMMFRGSPDLGANQLSGIYARMGGELNAFTTNNITSYFFLTSAHDIDVALHIGAIRMAGVNDSESEWKKERGAIEQEVARDKSTPFYLLYEKLLKHMFAGTPYAHDALGSKASFDKTTGAMLRRFHKKWYAPNNALLVVTGDVDPKAVVAKVKKLYGSIPAQELPNRPTVKLSPVSKATFTTPSDQPYGLVFVAFRMPGYRSAHYPAAKLAASALASQRGPIAALRYKGKALASGFEMQTMPEAGIGFAFAVYSPGGDADTTRKALVAAINKVRTDGVKPDLVTAAKRHAVLGHELQRNSVFGLARTWTQALAVAGLDSPAESLKRLRTVTPDQVNAQVRNLDLDHAITLIAEPTPGTQPKSGKGFGGKESFGSKPKGPVTLPDWAKTRLAKLPHPKPFLQPADMTLDNGLRLIVQPLKVSHSVSLYGMVKQNGDMQAPKGEKGVGSLLGALFDYGPKGMTRLQYQAAQDDIGAQLSVGANFSLAVLPQHFGEGVQLLANGLLHPSLPARGFKIQRMLLARQTAGRVNSPEFKFQLALQKALLPKGDPGLRIATPKSVASLTPDKLQAYHQQVYRPDETTIVVIGDITPKKAKSVVKKYFGDWKAEGAKPETDYPPVALSTSSRVRVPDPMKKQNKVVLAETLGVNFTDPDHFALDLANNLLSGGFYASPLYHELREKLGLVYTVGSQFGFGRNRSTFEINYGSYPKNVDKARDAAINVLTKTIETPLSKDQLHLAKSIGLRRIELGKQSVGAIGKDWLGRSANDLPLDQDYIMARHYEQLTAPEMQRILKKYLDPKRLSTVILGQPAK
jgi:zinc protease